MNSESCSIVGCERIAVVRMGYDPLNRIGYDKSVEYMLTVNTGNLMTVCLPCRRAIDFGVGVSHTNLFDEWIDESQKDSFKEKSSAVHRSASSIKSDQNE